MRVASSSTDKTSPMFPPKDRDIAMVFQSYALYPHMTVADNMAFSLKIAGIPKEERNRQVLEAAKLLDLEDYLDRRPRALSGGQRQRVAMGRAIVRSPKVFLMDEPLSNLDAKLRVQTRTQIAALTRNLQVTTVYVTHDQVEAMTMGDRVCVLKDGILQQVDVPRNLYARPANVFVAGFIGSPSMNLLTASHDGTSVDIGGQRFAVPDGVLQRASGSTVILGMRPEDLRIVAPDAGGLEMEVIVTEELGADAYIYGIPKGFKTLQPTIVRVDGRKPPMKDETVHIVPEIDYLHVFDAETGLRLNEAIPEDTPHAQLADVAALQREDA